MDRKGRTVRFLLIAACASLAAISPLRAFEAVAAASATQLPDGIWTVQGRAIQGTRRCDDVSFAEELAPLLLRPGRIGCRPRRDGSRPRRGAFGHKALS